VCDGVLLVYDGKEARQRAGRAPSHTPDRRRPEKPEWRLRYEREETVD
jgi:hypothetical protein